MTMEMWFEELQAIQLCETVYNNPDPGEVFFSIGTIGFVVCVVMTSVLVFVYYLMVWSEYENSQTRNFKEVVKTKSEVTKKKYK